MPAEDVNFEVQDYSRLTFLTLKPGESAKVGFIESIPGKKAAATKIKQHWIAEKSNGNYIMCTGGRCCEIETYNSRSKTYEKSKPKTVYWVPIVIYYNDPETMMPKAGVGILSLNHFQWGRLVETIQSCEPGTLPFFSRDITVSYDKNGQYNDYFFIKGEKRAVWTQNPEMTATIEEQLKTLAQEIQAAMPPEYSESELEELIAEWDKKKAARNATNDLAEAYNAPVNPAITVDVATPGQSLVQPTPAQQAVAAVNAVPPVQPAPAAVQAQPAVQPAINTEIPAVNQVSNESFTLSDLESVINSEA